MKIGKASFYNNLNYNMDDLYNQFVGKNKPSLRNLFQTKIKREDKIKLAREFVWSVGLLYKIIQLKTNYISDGFEIYSEDKEILNEFRELNEKIDIEKYIQNSAWEHEVVGEWTPFINWDGNDLINLTILNPEKVEVKSIFGKDLVFVKPPDEFSKLYSSNDKEVKKRLKRIIPKNYYEKWSKGQEVLLDEDTAKRYFNQKSYHENYSSSPIEPIFDDLALLAMYKDSDYSVAYKIKKAILQVKVGNKDFNGDEPIDSDVIDEAEEMFKNPSESSEIFTQWFMDAEWIIPDSDVYYPEKYEPVTRSILEWSGLSVFISEDTSYGGGGEKSESFYNSIKNARKEIKKSKGDQFAPEVADAFLKIEKELYQKDELRN